MLPFSVTYVNDDFWYDWYDGRPVEWPLIAEVAAARTPGEQFVEIYNPGGKPVGLGGYWLKTSGGRWLLPENLVLHPHETLLIARDGAAFRARFGLAAQVELPDLELGERADVLTLGSAAGRLDQVAWGSGKAGWSLAPGRGALCRPDPRRDTNSPLDWTGGAAFSPGRPGC